MGLPRHDIDKYGDHDSHKLGKGMKEQVVLHADYDQECGNDYRWNPYMSMRENPEKIL